MRGTIEMALPAGQGMGTAHAHRKSLSPTGLGGWRSRHQRLRYPLALKALGAATARQCKTAHNRFFHKRFGFNLGKMASPNLLPHPALPLQSTKDTLCAPFATGSRTG